jgi:hypothetical protein
VLARGSVNGFVAMVCALAEDTASPSEQELANARLIAAAPELLAAAMLLDSIETRIDHGDAELSDEWPLAMSALRAAIAKATGD